MSTSKRERYNATFKDGGLYKKFCLVLCGNQGCDNAIAYKTRVVNCLSGWPCSQLKESFT